MPDGHAVNILVRRPPMRADQVGAMAFLAMLWLGVIGLQAYHWAAFTPTGWCRDKGVAMTGSGVLSRVNFWYRIPCDRLPPERRRWPEISANPERSDDYEP